MNGKPPFQLIRNDADEDQKFLKLLIHGIHGAGKTFLAGTSVDVSEMNDVIMLSVEGGDMTLKNNDAHDFDNLDKVQARSFDAIAAFQKFIIAHCKLRDNPSKEAQARLKANEEWLRSGTDIKVDKPKHFRTVIIDSLAEIDSIHRNRLQGIEDSTDIDIDPQDSTWALYNQNLSRITRFCKQLRDLPVNVIFTAPSIQDRNGKWRPKMVGQLATDIQGIVDVVGYLESGQLNKETGHIPRRLWVMPTQGHDAKCRGSKNKEPFFMDPNMGTLMKAVGLVK